MAKVYHSARRVELSNSYRKLHLVLEQEPKLCPDPSPLIRAAEDVDCHNEDGFEIVEHELSRLILHFDNTNGCFPDSIVNLDCILTLSAASSFPQHDTPLDPFDRLAIDFEFTGSAGHPNARTRVQFWHFDRNIESEGDNAPLDAHPLYHFQFGGYRMRDHAQRQRNPVKAFGHLILLEAPRIAHPPLDAILAFDFALSNFAGSLRKELLTKDRSYRSLLSEHQQKFWKPYHDVLACLWDATLTSDERWSGEKIWPQFLDNSHLIPLSLIVDDSTPRRKRSRRN